MIPVNKTAQKKIFLMVILPIITVVAGLEMYTDYREAYNFSADGVVVEASWNTPNHNIPLFKIKTVDTIKQFHHAQVILEPDQIKVGDSFKKAQGSKDCIINGDRVKCVK
ncbi:hypothetical protein FLL45_09865 [Aliikangiella marina]|uniref:Uncharacterized protein n=1 Tax=Aliikangiella marina TaxID=1712262 RepID=A0A545TDD8_9GAMM|nr:hypothetical protein [Aliikangiella marina]TQV75232.1 hypothetical protein FLL45_09865 [Aliikangiella marina]